METLRRHYDNNLNMSFFLLGALLDHVCYQSSVYHNVYAIM